MTMQNNIDIFRRTVWRNMLQPKSQSAPDKIDHERPIEIGVAVAAHDHDRRADRAQFIENCFRANVAKMPDFIRIRCQIDNGLGQFVVGVCKDEDFHQGRFAISKSNQAWTLLTEMSSLASTCVF
jgi:hypothetical protein